LLAVAWRAHAMVMTAATTKRRSTQGSFSRVSVSRPKGHPLQAQESRHGRDRPLVGPRRLR
jgi:hypothetical protein